MSGEFKAVVPSVSESEKPTAKVKSIKPDLKEVLVSDEARITAERERLSHARSFDRLTEANVTLVRSVNRLVKLSYVVQVTQLFCLLVMFIYALVK